MSDTMPLPKIFLLAAGSDGVGRACVARQLFDTATEFYEAKNLPAFYAARIQAWKTLGAGAPGPVS